MAKSPWLMLLFFVAGLGLFQVQSWTQRRSTALREANMELTSALYGTEEILRKNVIPILLDKALAQNLGWKLHHSVASVLTARTMPGIIQDLSLWSGDCKLIAQSGLKAARESCPIDPNIVATAPQTSKEVVRWMGEWSLEGSDMVLKSTVSLPLATEPTFLVVHSALDGEWLAQFPALNEALALARGKLQLQAPENQGAGVTPLPKVVPQSSFDGKIIGFLVDGTEQGWTRTSRALNKLAWAFWGLAMILGVTWIVRLKKLMSHTTLQMSQFLQWSQSVLDTGRALDVYSFEGGPNRLKDWGCSQEWVATASLEDLIIKQGNLITHSQELWDLVLKINRQDFDDLEQKKKDLERDLERQTEFKGRLEQKMRDSSKVESLQWQFSSFLGPYHAKLEGLLDGLEDLLATLKVSEIGNRDHRQLLGDWTQQIAHKGSRKFIRSLSETRGASEGVSALDDQIAAMVAMTDSQSALIAAGMTLGAKLMGEWKQSLKVVHHWDSLIPTRKEEVPRGGPLSGSLLESILDAQEMVLWNLGRSPDQDCFINQFKVDPAIVMDLNGLAELAEPMGPLWTSAFLHIYSVLLGDTPAMKVGKKIGKCPKIFTTLRARGTEVRLIVYGDFTANVVGDRVEDLCEGLEERLKKSTASLSLSAHGEALKRIQGLLYNQGVQCALLPQIDDQVAFSLTWTQPPIKLIEGLGPRPNPITSFS